MNFYSFFLAASQGMDIPVDMELKLNHYAEHSLLQTAFLFKVAIEYAALLVLVIGIIRGIGIFWQRKPRKNEARTIILIRSELGMYLSLALELLLAADVVATAVSPSWEAIGKLAAISAIRTFLNYFLQQEVKELEHHRRSTVLRQTSRTASPASQSDRY